MQQASWLLAALALFLVLKLHLLPALLAGLLVYELVHLMATPLERHLSNRRAKIAAVLLLAILVVAIVGVGAMHRLTAVRWGVAGTIVWAWILTIPLSALIAATFYAVLMIFD